MRARRSEPLSRSADNHLNGSGTVVAEFRDRAALNRAVRELMGHSVPADSIQVFMRSPDGRRREVPVEEGAGVLRGALLGAGAGAALGVLIVVLVLTGAFGDPGVGLFGLRGLVGAVQTVAMAAAAAVPLGALLGMGRWRSGDLGGGTAEVVVTSEALEHRAREILQRWGAVRTDGH